MVKLKSGIEVSQQLVDTLLVGKELNVCWETTGNRAHPGMNETQYWVVPRAIDGCELPAERIAYYSLTRFQDNEGVQHELYLVEDSSEYVEAGSIVYALGERMSIPVDSKQAAEEMVIKVLRNFIKSDLPNS